MINIETVKSTVQNLGFSIEAERARTIYGDKDLYITRPGIKASILWINGGSCILRVKEIPDICDIYCNYTQDKDIYVISTNPINTLDHLQIELRKLISTHELLTRIEKAITPVFPYLLIYPEFQNEFTILLSTSNTFVDTFFKVKHNPQSFLIIKQDKNLLYQDYSSDTSFADNLLRILHDVDPDLQKIIQRHIFKTQFPSELSDIIDTL